MKKILLIFPISIVVMFLFFGFVLMDWNPSNWEMTQRFLLLFLSVCLTIIIMTLYNVSKI